MSKILPTSDKILLRTHLSLITENRCFPDSQVNEIKKIQQQYAHSIRVLESPTKNLTFNCVCYALGLTQDGDYHRLVSTCKTDVHADTGFVGYLIDLGVMIKESDANVGLAGVYYDDGRIAHIGRFVSNSRLVSKWGGGLLWEHEAFEVPEEYGNELCVFSIPDVKTTCEHFLNYVRGKGELL